MVALVGGFVGDHDRGTDCRGFVTCFFFFLFFLFFFFCASVWEVSVPEIRSTAVTRQISGKSTEVRSPNHGFGPERVRPEFNRAAGAEGQPR